jgi:hypothetical protein
MSQHSSRAFAFAVVLLGALVLLVLLAGPRGALREGQAAPANTQVDIQYLAVTGEGSTAKAWYDGAAAAGVPLQDALDKFAKDGYRVARVADTLHTQTDSTSFAILLQRVR